MGCTNSRSGKVNSMLSTECDDLMKSNLNILRIIECLYIQQRKLNLALSILYLKKHSEQYYKVVQNFRRFWLSDSKSSSDEATLNKKLEKCERQQTIERDQLVNCQSQLTKILSDLYPSWSNEFSTLLNFLENLELSPSVTQASTSLYGNFYISSDRDIKEGILEYGDLSQPEKDLLKRIKEVAIYPYKDDKTCVYATDRVVIRKRRKRTKEEQPVTHKREESVHKEVVVVKETINLKEPASNEKITKGETELSSKFVEPVENEDESSFESYTETDEDDEQYLARLSVSQK